MLAGVSPASVLRAAATKRFTRPAVRRAAGASALTGSAGTPRAWGSVSERRPESPVPRRTRTKRCSFTGSTKSFTPRRRIPRRRWQRLVQRSVAMRPARRSVMRPSRSTVQKLPRAATSPARTSKSMPSASSTPRPTWYRSGSYPKRPRCPGPLPGVIPGPTCRSRPQAERAARAWRFGIRAVSSSDLPVSGWGSPPRPSSDRRTSLVVFGTISARISSRSMDFPRRSTRRRGHASRPGIERPDRIRRPRSAGRRRRGSG